jgi:hypothetical protein
MSRQSILKLFCVTCIVLAVYAWYLWLEALPQYKNEIFIIPTIILYTLTFPISLIIQIIYTGMAFVMPIDKINIGSEFLNWIIITWLPLSVFGYLQWFVWVPRLVRHWRGDTLG